tara:strand:- start:431 stop:652 length:222 start_codon:yes stop_codon:yes gene_type:complete
MEAKIIEKFLQLLEDAKLKIKGGRGGGTGTPYQVRDTIPILGKSKYAIEEVEAEEEEGKVKVSKAFLKEEDDE